MEMGPLYTPLDEVMRSSDVITLQRPLMPSTRNMIAGREFALMEHRPLLINTARDGLVEEEVLVSALDARQIDGAGFDVVTREPPREASPAFDSGNPMGCKLKTSHLADESAAAV